MWIYNLNTTLMWFEPTSTPTFLSQTLNAFFADFQSFCQRFKFTKIIAKVDCEALGLEIRWTIEQ